MRDFPLIKFVLLVIAGILISRSFSPDINIIFFLLLSVSLASLLLYIINFKKIKIMLPALIYTLPLLGGLLIHQICNSDNHSFLPQNLQKQKDFTAFGIITNIELKREREIFFHLQTDSIILSSKSFNREVKLIAKIKDDSKRKIDSVYALLNPGNIVSINGTYVKGRERRNPGEFDYNKYLKDQGISGTLTSYRIEDLSIVKTDKYFFKSIIFNCRKYLDDQISELHEPQTAALLKGLILADRSEIDFETKTNFVNSGVIHVLAVSGLHVGYIALIFIFLFGRFNPYIQSLFTIAGLITFMLITGMPPSVFRATIMAVIIIIGYLTNRTSNIFNSLAFAAIVILVINPDELFSPGFQLSFSAVVSIAAIYPLINKEILSWRIKSTWLKNILLFGGVSLSAQIGTLPFTLAYFGKLSIVALFANLMVIPLIGLILGVAFFTLALNSVTTFFASASSSVNDLLSSGLFWLVNLSGSSEYSFIPIRQFSLIDAIIFYFFLTIALIFYSQIRLLTARIIFMLLIFINILFLSSLDDKDLLLKGELDVLIIDIGQGDAIFMKFPGGETALIDAGEANFYFDNGERVILPLLNNLGIEKVDYAFISHMDSDHYSGFVSLIHNNVIKKIIKPRLDTSLAHDVKFEKYARMKKIPIEYYERGAAAIGDVRLYTLNDNNNPLYNSLSTNDKSGLLKIVYGKTSFLFTGDMERKGENYYVKLYRDFLNADVLKVGHHGSTTSSTPALVNYVKPKISLISAGIKNKYNHPSDIILNRLNSAGSIIHRTDLEGAILYRSNGDSVYFVNWKNY